MLVSLVKRIGLKLSLNDPRWGSRKDNKHAQEGKKPGDGPPDLEQVWRDFNARLNAFFGPKNRPGGGGGGGGNLRPDMKGAGATAGVLAGVALLIWLASGTFLVQEGHIGVIFTFGHNSALASPGLNWRLPYPFQTNETVNVSQLRAVEVGYRSQQGPKIKMPNEALMLTEDENIVDIQFAVQYTLKNPQAWLINNTNPEENLLQVAETAMREIVGRSTMDFVLYEGRAKVASDVQQLMQKILDSYGSGALISNVTMQVVQPPEQVQASFDDAVKAGQDRERQKNEGQAYANDVIPKARGAAFRLIQEAEAYRSLVSDNALGNASRFQQVLTEYQKAPGVTRDRMYLETMQQIFSSASKVMVDAKSGSNLLYLPLDKLIAQNAASDASARAAQGAQGASNAPAAPLDVLQNAEALRQRESRSRESSRDRESR